MRVKSYEGAPICTLIFVNQVEKLLKSGIIRSRIAPIPDQIGIVRTTLEFRSKGNSNVPLPVRDWYNDYAICGLSTILEV
jgi:hypothetical protein